MGNPIQNVQKDSPFTGYVQLSPLKANNLAKGTTYTPSIMAGAGIDTKHFEMKFDAGYSANSVLDASLEVGPKFKLDDNWNLNTGLKFTYTGEVGNDKNSVTMSNRVTHNNATYEQIDDISWNEETIRFGAKAEAEYSKGKLNLGVGLEGGYYSKGPDIYMQSEVYVGDEHGGTSQIMNFERKGKNGAFLTPTISADYSLGKGFSLNLKANAFEGNAGIRYTF